MNSRTCIVCKTENEKSDFLRFVKNLENCIIFDIFSKAPGRGAYVCTKQKCLTTALDKKIIGKILKAQQKDSLPEDIKQGINLKIKGSLLLLNKAGLLTIGTDQVSKDIKLNKIYSVIVATDTSEKTKEKMISLGSTKNVEVVEFFDKQILSDIFKNANCSIVGLKQNKLTQSILRSIKTYKILTNA